MTTEVTHRTLETNGIRMHLAEAGQGPLVVLCHGFPESWYSWRHQLRALADAGFRAVAPDMRGYGQSEAPAEIERYTLLHLVGDMVGLLDALGAPTAVIAGHDWGAPVAWRAGLGNPAAVGMVPRGGGFLKHTAEAEALPAWLTEADVDFFAGEFSRAGFRGGLNWYRNIDRSWELLAPFAGARVSVPALYVAGDLDPVVAFRGMDQLLA